MYLKIRNWIILLVLINILLSKVTYADPIKWCITRDKKECFKMKGEVDCSCNWEPWKRIIPEHGYTHCQRLSIPLPEVGVIDIGCCCTYIKRCEIEFTGDLITINKEKTCCLECCPFRIYCKWEEKLKKREVEGYKVNFRAGIGSVCYRGLSVPCPGWLPENGIDPCPKIEEGKEYCPPKIQE